MAATVQETTPRWLASLNPEQLAAATHEGSEPLLVLAGAGTGKTTTLCARVAHLVDSGVPAERILLVTFTRRAAREMLQRTRALVPASSRVAGGTFHSTAHRLVRRHAASLGLPPGFGVLDAGDAADVLDLLREEAGHAKAKSRFPKKSTLLDLYSRTVNAQAPLSEVLAEHFPWCAEHREAISALFREYTSRKRGLGVVDLDDLLLSWRALARDPVVGRALAAAFDHVLIDEYQDVNGLQVEIVRGLAGAGTSVGVDLEAGSAPVEEGEADGPTITAVGDDLQAIYGFRSASAEHILSFPSHFPGARVVTLERNYRSTQPVLDVANVVAAEAQRAFPKVLRAERPGGVAPGVIFVRDESAQAEAVCDRVLEAREQGMALREQAVLMRTSHDSALLELELGRRGVPFVKYGGLRYLEAAHVKDFVAALRIADNAQDDLALFRVLQLVEGVGPAGARRAIDALRAPVDAGGASVDAYGASGGAGGASVDAGGASVDAGGASVDAGGASVDAGGASVDTGAASLNARGVSVDAGGGSRFAGWPSAREHLAAPARAGADALVTALGEAAGIAVAGARAEVLRDALAPLIRTRYPDGDVRLADLDQLVAAAHEARDARHFVAELVLDPPSSSADLAQPPHLDEDWLVLSTVHSAKGLEWAAVHVLAVYDGNFPACMSAGNRETVEEERRLLYVAMTRAQRTLTLYVPVRYHHRPFGSDDAHGYGKPSRFLSAAVLERCDVRRLPDDPWGRDRARSDQTGAAGGARADALAARRVAITPDALFD